MAASSKKVIYAALLGNTLIVVTKFVAATVTGSSAMLSEGIHSLVDTGNQVLLLYGMKRAKRPADREFPFGHGKELYFWSFVVAILIFAVGAGVSIYEGILHLRHPEPIESPYVNYIVLGLAMLIEGGAWLYAWKEFKVHKGRRGYIRAVHEGKDPTLFVVLFEDTAAMAGLIVAFFGSALEPTHGRPLFRRRGLDRHWAHPRGDRGLACGRDEESLDWGERQSRGRGVHPTNRREHAANPARERSLDDAHGSGLHSRQPERGVRRFRFRRRHREGDSGRGPSAKTNAAPRETCLRGSRAADPAKSDQY